jgi:Arabinose efflux permease
MTRSNRIRLSVVLYLNYFVHGMGLLILALNMKALGNVWGTPLATVSYVISGVGIGRLLAYYLLGSLSDRYGRKNFIYLGMLCYLIFFAGMILTRDFRAAYLLAILAGVANSALDSGTYPTFLEMNPKNGSANILIKAAMSAGEFILPVFVGFNENLGGWYGYTFIFAGAFLLINFLLISRTTFPHQSESEKKTGHRLFAGKKISGARLGLITILSIYGFTSMALMILYTQWITLYGIDSLHMSNMEAHLLLSLYSIGSITGVLLIYFILKRSLINQVTLIVGLNGLSLLLLLLICFATNPLLVSISSFVFGITAAGGVMQAGLNILLSLFPNAKGRVTGIFFSFGSIASFTVPLITGKLSEISSAAALRADLIVALISFALWLIIQKLMAVTDEQAVCQKERDRINLIDYWILRLLQWRFRQVRTIGIKKLNRNDPIFDPEREKRIMSRIDRLVADGENTGYYQAIYQTILSSSKHYQSKIQERGRNR